MKEKNNEIIKGVVSSSSSSSSSRTAVSAPALRCPCCYSLICSLSKSPFDSTIKGVVDPDTIPDAVGQYSVGIPVGIL